MSSLNVNLDLSSQCVDGYFTWTGCHPLGVGGCTVADLGNETFANGYRGTDCSRWVLRSLEKKFCLAKNLAKCGKFWDKVETLHSNQI